MKQVPRLSKRSGKCVEAMDGCFEGLKRPIFSIVIGTYQQAHLLPKVLRGWEDQRYANGFEVFLCDDASLDETKKWAENYAKTTPLQFKYLRIKKRVKPGCLSKNLNQALPHLRGHYTLFSMGDTVPQDDTLIQYAKHLGANRVLCGIRHNVNESLEFQSIDWRYEGRETSQKAEIIPVTDKAPWAAITGNGLLVPTWALKKVGGWDEEYRGWGNDDYDLALRLYELGLEFYLTPQAVLLHIDHPRGKEAGLSVKLFHKRLREHRRRVREEIKTIVLDFDDFSPLNNGLFYLKKLKEHFPKMKVSLFTVPFKIVGQNREKVEFWPQYLDLVKEINSLDWIEILPHGFFHTRGEFQKMTYDQTVLALLAIEELFYRLEFNWKKGFKAPFWEIGEEAMRALMDNGYFLAVNPEEKQKMNIPKGLRVYEPNWGVQFPIPRGKTELRGHGHIQNWSGTGLAVNFGNLLDLPTDAKWKFVSECVLPIGNINTTGHWNMVHKLFLDGYRIRGKKCYMDAIRDRKALVVEQIPKTAKKIIELGCGLGEVCGLIKERCPRANIWGVDFSEVAIGANKRKYPELHFILGDIREKLSIKERFDVVVSEEVWEHLEDPRDLIRNTSRLLKSGGKFVFLLPFADRIPSNEHLAEYTVGSTEEILSGFKELTKVRVKQVIEGLYILVTGNKA